MRRKNAPRGLPSIRFTFFRVAVLAFSLGAMGCQTTTRHANRPSTESPTNTVTAHALEASGEIIRVNAAQNYVIVKCTVLPSGGEEVTVYRRDQKVGRIRMSGPMRSAYVAADVLDGRPQRGDRVGK